MTDTIEGGEVLAWRLLATLEGGTLLLAASALLAYTVRIKIFSQNRCRRTVKNVLITNTTNSLGRELKRRLEAHGCVVEEVNRVTSGTGSEASSGTSSRAGSNVDAIVVVGAASKTDGLDGLATLVTEDVNDNLKLLESVSSQVQHGGYIAWVCTRDKDATPGTFSGAEEAFDTVLQASLLHLAKRQNCNPIWVGRCEEVEQAVEQLVAALLITNTEQPSRFSIRNTTHFIGEFLGRWLKIDT